jgi:hypothetical protein
MVMVVVVVAAMAAMAAPTAGRWLPSWICLWPQVMTCRCDCRLVAKPCLVIRVWVGLVVLCRRCLPGLAGVAYGVEGRGAEAERDAVTWPR